MKEIDLEAMRTGIKDCVWVTIDDSLRLAINNPGHWVRPGTSTSTGPLTMNLKNYEREGTGAWSNGSRDS